MKLTQRIQSVLCRLYRLMILHGIALIGLMLLLGYLLDYPKKHEPRRAMIIFFSTFPLILPLFRWQQ